MSYDQLNRVNKDKARDKKNTQTNTADPQVKIKDFITSSRYPPPIFWSDTMIVIKLPN